MILNNYAAHAFMNEAWFSNPAFGPSYLSTQNLYLQLRGYDAQEAPGPGGV